MDAVTATVTTCTGDAGIITAGTGAGAITGTGGTGAAATTGIGISDRVSLEFAFAIPLPGRMRMAAMRTGRAPQARPVQRATNAGAPPNEKRVQPSSISTAIRIRSEWFLAPSFCLSSEVVLATVL